MRCRYWGLSRSVGVRAGMYLKGTALAYAFSAHRIGEFFVGRETTQVHIRSRLDLTTQYYLVVWPGQAARPSCRGHSQYLPSTTCIHYVFQRLPKSFP